MTYTLSHIEAHFAKDASLLHAMSPYLRLEYAGNQFLTTVVKGGGPNCAWGQPVLLTSSSTTGVGGPAHLKVIAMAQKKLGADKVIGIGQADLAAMAGRGVQAIPLTFETSGGGAGQVLFQVEQGTGGGAGGAAAAAPGRNGVVEGVGGEGIILDREKHTRDYDRDHIHDHTHTHDGAPVTGVAPGVATTRGSAAENNVAPNSQYLGSGPGLSSKIGQAASGLGPGATGTGASQQGMVPMGQSAGIGGIGGQQQQQQPSYGAGQQAGIAPGQQGGLAAGQQGGIGGGQIMPAGADTGRPHEEYSKDTHHSHTHDESESNEKRTVY